MKNNFLPYSLLCISVGAVQAQQLPELYRSIKILPFHMDTSLYGNGCYLEQIFAKHKGIKTVVEVGSWMGASTVHIASLLPSDGKVYAVDHWRGSEEHQKGKELWTPVLPYLYEQFLSNVVHKGLAHKIIPMRMDSLAASKVFNAYADLVYLDAAHDTDSVYADLKAWFPHVKGHGILCGDDWGWPTVRVAVNRFAQENNLRIEANNNFWVVYEQ